MALKKLALLTAAILLSSGAFANFKAANLTIPGGIIKPHEIFTLASDKLVPGASYSLTCTIKDSNNSKNPVFIRVFVRDNTTGTGPGALQLNGESFYGQTTLTQITNTLVIPNFTTSTTTTISNLDNTDSIELVGCNASPVTY